MRDGALNVRRIRAISASLAVVGACLSAPVTTRAQLQPVVPPDQRGRLDAERVGTHDAANLRTSFTNFGMVGDYPPDPGNVDLSVFHSVEVPKGSGLNYSDGVTPFVLARIIQQDGTPAYIMETGFRERQANSPTFNRVMRFEPRPGYFQANPNINRGRSPAISNDPRTWPNEWPNRLTDPDDPGWSGSWNGYFGKRAAADQESFTVMDDQFYDAWNYVPDSRDPSRKGLGLRVEVRGFQWANPQAGNVIFWHYDITNESTTNYVDNIVFGLYMDSGVGGPRVSCDGIAESDDDNAFFDRTTGLNLVYTWDRSGHGTDLSSNCARTGYLGYAYLETPGNPLDLVDNDNDGITNELRDGGPGLEIVGESAILAYVAANYDTADFRRFYGTIESRPPFRVGRWWTGDEDMDWIAEFHDVGADGVAGTSDTGESDGMPTQGEPNFDRTDLNESDQIGLTGFKLNRIRVGQDNPNPPEDVDGIVFYTDNANWPQRLFEKFSDPDPAVRFDSPLASNYNIAFLFASGPFTLPAGKTERFSLALAYGGDLTELTSTVRTVQQIYDANYQFAVPPPVPTVTAEAGDGRVRLSWDDVAERGIDPVTTENDFEGYRIYRATDPEFRDPRRVTTGRGTGPLGNGVPIAQFDLVNGRKGFSPQVVEGVAYWLGEDNGIRHTWTDTTAVNGQLYYYAVCSYDRGSDSLNFYPSENSISVSRTPRGGTILPTNVASVRPNPRVLGWEGATVSAPVHAQGTGSGTVDLPVVNTDEVLNGHLYAITFTAPADDSIRAVKYEMRDSTDHRAVFDTGADLVGAGIGPPGDGLLPIIDTPLVTSWDPARSGFAAGSPTNTHLKVSYQPVLSPNLRRVGYPDSLSIVFDDVVRDTGLIISPFVLTPAKFRVIAHTATGDRQLDFRFRDVNGDNTVSHVNDIIDVVTYAGFAPTAPQVTWRFQLDTLGQGARGPIVPPRLGDVYDFKVLKPFGSDDVFVFTTQGQSLDAAQAQATFKDAMYVVPNPYVGSASFEPERFAVSGRGERRIEFRGVTAGCIIRIYTVTGNLVQTLRHDGSTEGFVPWNLRTKDNLDVAPGLYVFHAESPGIGTQVGKFAIIK